MQTERPLAHLDDCSDPRGTRKLVLSRPTCTAVLLWLHDPDLDIPAPLAAEVIAATESWVMRRLMLRLTGAALGRVVGDLT